MVLVNPNKAEDMVRAHPNTLAWCELGINLAEDEIVGLFNFGPNSTRPGKVWAQLEDKAETQNIDIEDLVQIQCLAHKGGTMKGKMRLVHIFWWESARWGFYFFSQMPFQRLVLASLPGGNLERWPYCWLHKKDHNKAERGILLYLSCL